MYAERTERDVEGGKKQECVFRGVERNRPGGGGIGSDLFSADIRGGIGRHCGNLNWYGGTGIQPTRREDAVRGS